MKEETLTPTERAYESALDYLYSFINLESKTLERYHASKMDPDRPRRLLELLGNPHQPYPAMHIAGTKGKGSVAAMCASVLQGAGLRVGLYTSPHLRDFRERIRVVTPEDPVGMIEKQDFVDRLEEMKEFIPLFPGITWFEIVTAIAFLHFATQDIDIGVIEVGLGGRLDATNVLHPLVSVITSLSLDHANLLGHTLTEIASEKGGIIKREVPVVVAPQVPGALARLREIAAAEHSPLEIVGFDWQYTGRNHQLTLTRSAHEAYVPGGTQFEVALSGIHQLENAVLAIAALRPVQDRFPAVTLGTIQQGLASVQWEGRLEMIFERPGLPSLLVDAAHNQHSATKLSAALQNEYTYNRLWLVFGAPADKSIGEMMKELFPLAHEIIVAAADHPRAASPESLAEMAQELGFEVQTAESPEAALAMTFAQAGEGDLICATGSIIFLGDLLNQWDRLQSEFLFPKG